MRREPIFLILSVGMLFPGAEVGRAGSLVVHWAFDETSGSLVHDSSGNGYDGVITGTPDWVPGQMAGALHFDGSSYVTVDDAMGQFTTISVALWFKYDSFIADWNSIWHNNGWQGGWLHHMVTNYAGQDIRVQFAVNGAGDQFGITPIETDTWYHSVVTYDSAAGEMNFYLTTAEERTANLDVALQVNGPAVTLTAGQIGGWEGNRLSSATFDDIRIYSRVLTKSHIQDLLDGISPNFSKAEKPNPADGAIGVTTPLLQWSNGETAMFHDVYLGTSPDLTEANLVAARQPFAMYYHVLGFEPGVTYYWRVDEIEANMITVHTGDVWNFTTMPLTAWAPAPADGAGQILLEPTLAWTAGQGAVGHQLYLGSDLDAVSAGAAETDMGEIPAGETAYQVTTSLEMDTVYYWRVDGTNTAGTVETGEVWSFTTITPGPGGAIREWWLGVSGTDLPTLRGDPDFPDNPSGRELVDLMEGPVDWADNYGSRIYGWLYPQETGDYTFWISADDNAELLLSTDADPANATAIAGVPEWSASREWHKFADQTSAPQSLVAGQVYYIEGIMNEGGGGDNLAVAWQGPGVPFGVIGSDVVAPTSVYPVKAFAPSPADGAVDTIQSLILSWSAGQGASQHAVYLGDDADAVANADTATADIFRGQQAGTAYNTGPLEWGKTYYWRIDENTAAEAGRVWTFTTANFINVEDFESYDDADNRIYQTWIDGAENGTGSYVGYEVAGNGTFGETVIVHGGGQSMPLEYDNANSPFYSETERTFDTPRDWTVNGVDALVLYVRGSAGNDAEPLYVGVEDSSGNLHVVVHPDPAMATAGGWNEWKTPLSEFSDKNVNLAAVKKMYIGLGDRDAPAPGGAGLIFIDDIRVTTAPQVE